MARKSQSNLTNKAPTGAKDFKMSDNKKMLLIAGLFILASCIDPLLLALGL